MVQFETGFETGPRVVQFMEAGGVFERHRLIGAFGTKRR